MTGSTRATEQTLSRVYSALLAVKSGIDSLSGQFNSDDVTISSPSDFPDAAANIKLTDLIASVDAVLAELQTSSVVTIDGGVAISNLPATYPDQHSQPLTDAQLRAVAVPVDDGHPDPQTNALTDAQLRATPLDVALTGEQMALTDVQLRATPVKVDDDTSQANLVAIFNELVALHDTTQAEEHPDHDLLSVEVTDGMLAALVRAVVAAKNPSGTYVHLSVDAEGNLEVTEQALADDGAAAPTSVKQVGGRDASGNLQALSVEDDGTLAGVKDIKRAITDYETRLDYDVRTDGNPVYVGKAPQGTLTSAASWSVQKLTYDGSDRLVRAEVVSDVVWDDRAGAF